MKIKSCICAMALAGSCLLSHFAIAGSLVEVNPPVVPSSFLTGIAVLNDRDVWAVGAQQIGSYKTLTEHWDGSSWTVVPSPNQFPTFSFLYGVAALASNNVWAVGYGAQGDLKTVVIHWDGSTWTSVPSPNLDNMDNYLLSITAVSADDLWALGYSDFPSGAHHYLPLAEHWDGSAWTIVPTPQSVGTTINSVHATATNDVWAVGNTTTSRHGVTTETSYTMHWDGTNWNTISSPNGTLQLTSLRGVSGIAANDIWAVGSNGSDFTTPQAFAIHWDGTTWNVVPTASESGVFELDAVMATTSNNVWAVGSANGQALAERWNGLAWKAAPLPALQDPSSLTAVAAGARGSLWSAGSQATGQLFLKWVR